MKPLTKIGLAVFSVPEMVNVKVATPVIHPLVVLRERLFALDERRSTAPC